jgi:hypothetical protein
VWTTPLLELLGAPPRMMMMRSVAALFLLTTAPVADAQAVDGCADLDDNGLVAVPDLLLLLAAFGNGGEGDVRTPAPHPFAG